MTNEGSDVHQGRLDHVGRLIPFRREGGDCREDPHVHQGRLDHLELVTFSDAKEVITVKIRTSIKAGAILWGD